MNIKITQYESHVDFNSKGKIKCLSIEYSGKMSIDINVDVKKVIMLDNKINIYFDKNTKLNGTLFTYKGSMNIKKATCWGVHGQSTVSIKLSDSTFQRVTDKWGQTHTNTWESYDSKIGALGETRRELFYNYKGIRIKKTPKFSRGK